MEDRADKWIKCDHENWIPIMYISSNIYIFLCSDCETLILRSFNDLKGGK